jgi:predicted nucleic acid-binding Zn ribbon protein
LVFVVNERKDKLTPLKDILANLFRDADLPFNPDDALIWKVWEDVVGPTIAKNAHPLWIKDRNLRVAVSDPIWLQELRFVEETMKDKLNQKIGRTAVETIEFRLGSKQIIPPDQ